MLTEPPPVTAPAYPSTPPAQPYEVVAAHLAWMSRLLARPRLHLRGLERCAQSLALYLNALPDGREAPETRAALQALLEYDPILSVAHHRADYLLRPLTAWIERQRGQAR